MLVRAVAHCVLEVAVAGSALNVLVVTVTLSIADNSKATCGASSNVLWYTIKGVVALLTAAESSTLAGELAHGHSRERSRVVVCRLVVMDLVDRYSGVNDIRLNRLLLYHRLNGFVDMVVNVLAANRCRSALAMSGGVNLPLVFEASLFIDKVPLCGIMITVVELSVLDCTELGGVLLRQDLTILNWLNSAVVVVLMDLFVDNCLNLLMLVRLYHFVLHGRSNSLVDGSVVVTRLGHEVGDSCLGLFHDV